MGDNNKTPSRIDKKCENEENITVSSSNFCMLVFSLTLSSVIFSISIRWFYIKENDWKDIETL